MNDVFPTQQLRRKGFPMADTFAEFVAKERDRIGGELARLRLERSKIGDAMFAAEKELGAIAAYETAKTGKPAKAPGQRASRSGSKREELLTVIRNHDGLNRGELLDKMGLKGNKQGEMSVSNALTALVKGNAVIRDGGRYRIAA